MHRPHFGDLPAEWMFKPVQLSLKAEFVLLILPCFRKPFSFRLHDRTVTGSAWERLRCAPFDRSVGRTRSAGAAARLVA